MSGLRGRSAVAVDHRSALPRVPGIPWWAAAIVASVLTALGVAYDAGTGGDNLSGVFAAFYVLGCVGAVVAVRQSGVFTAVIQPPLILFIAVPFAYFVFHGSTYTGVKDTLINYGYPLIERFPLMFFTTAAALLIGMIRWYLGAAARRSAPLDAEGVVEAPVEASGESVEAATKTAPKTAPKTTTRARRRTAARTTPADVVDAMSDDTPRPPRKAARASATDSPRSPSGATAGAESRRSRHSRPLETDAVDPTANRPRRRNTPPVEPPTETRRRPRASDPREPRERDPRDREPRAREPREREPRDRDSRDRRPLPPLDRRRAAERPDRSERPDRPQRRERPDAQERPQRRPRATEYEDYEPPPSKRTNGSSGTHHPVSRVRYRGADDGESRVEHRTRPSRHAAPDSWEYDV